MSEGMEEKAAEVLSQQYNIVAMIIFCASRFICTFILRYLSPGLLLKVLAIVACVFTAGVIGFQNIWGMYCLVGVSACMSLMFPTIYGIALQGLGDDAKFGAAGLIMAMPRRFDITAGSGKHYRLRYIDGHACCEPVIPPSVHLFCGDCDLWTPLLLQGENAKVIIDTSEFNSREPFIEKKWFSFLFI